MAKNPKGETLIRICPRCGSRDVVSPRIGRVITPGYLCSNCGFYSVLFPEVRLKEAKKLDKSSVKFSRFNYKSKRVKFDADLIMIILIFGIFIFWIGVILSQGL